MQTGAAPCSLLPLGARLWQPLQAVITFAQAHAEGARFGALVMLRLFRTRFAAVHGASISGPTSSASVRASLHTSLLLEGSGWNYSKRRRRALRTSWYSPILKTRLGECRYQRSKPRQNCAEQCRADQACDAFSFNKRTKICYLVTQPTGSTPNRLFASGMPRRTR
jgi:hypothetical protein